MWAHGSGDPKSEGLTRIAGMRSGNPSSLNVVNFRPSRRSTDTGPMRESDGAGSIASLPEASLRSISGLDRITGHGALYTPLKKPALQGGPGDPGAEDGTIHIDHPRQHFVLALQGLLLQPPGVDEAPHSLSSPITRTVRSSENGPGETSQGSRMLAPADSSMVVSFRRRMDP